MAEIVTSIHLTPLRAHGRIFLLNRPLVDRKPPSSRGLWCCFFILVNVPNGEPQVLLNSFLRNESESPVGVSKNATPKVLLFLYLANMIERSFCEAKISQADLEQISRP